MDGWWDGVVDGWMIEWVDGLMEGWVHRQTDRCKDE